MNRHLFIISVIILTALLNSTAYAGSILISEGSLEIEVVGDKAFLINVSQGKPFYFKFGDGKYIATYESRNLDALYFTILGENKPDHFILQNYKAGIKPIPFKALKISSGSTQWHIVQKKGQYFLSTQKTVHSVSLSGSADSPSVPSEKIKSRPQLDEKKFTIIFNKPPQEIKPVFTIDLTSKNYRDRLRNLIANKNSKNLEIYIKPLRNLISETIKKEYNISDNAWEKNRRLSLTKYNKLDKKLVKNGYEIQDLLDFLLEFQLTKSETNRQMKRKTYFNDFSKHEKYIAQIKTKKSKLNELKLVLKNKFGKINLVENEINRLQAQIKEKTSELESEKLMYQAEPEIHSQYGVFFVGFAKDPTKSFSFYEEPAKMEIERIAIKEMSNILINRETSISFNGHTGDRHFSSWIAKVQSGYIFQSFSKRDIIVIADIYHSIIKHLKFVPRIGSFKDPGSFLSSKEMQNMDIKSVYSPADIDAVSKLLSTRVRELKEKDRKKILDRIRLALDKAKLQDSKTARKRENRFKQFVVKYDGINKTIMELKKDLTQKRNQVKQINQTIKDSYESARRVKHEDIPDLNRKLDKQRSLTLKSVEQMFQLSLLEKFSNANEIIGKKSDISNIADLVVKSILRLDNMFEMAQATLITTIDNGFFKEISKSMRFNKKFNQIDVYVEPYHSGELSFTSAVIKANVEITPLKELEPRRFDAYMEKIEVVWQSIENIYSGSPETPPQEPDVLSCSNCITANGLTFNIKLFADEPNFEIYKLIAWGKKTVHEIISKFNQGTGQWSLPDPSDLKQLLSFLKKKKHKDLQLDDLDGRYLYVSGHNIGVSPKKYAAVYFKDKKLSDIKIIDCSDAANLILIKRKN